MSKTFWIFFLVGIAVVGVVVSGVLVGNKSAHLDLTGSVLKVRTLALNPNATLVVVDFRAANPSGVQFVVKEATVQVEQTMEHFTDGTFVSKGDLDSVFQYQKLLGPKFNDTLGIGDKINGGQKMDRVVAARFELPESTIDNRRSIRLRFQDLDGAIATIDEKPR